MLYKGITQDQIDKFTKHNPQKWLTFKWMSWQGSIKKMVFSKLSFQFQYFLKMHKAA